MEGSNMSANKRSVSDCVADIKRLNSFFRDNPGLPEDQALPLMQEKDRLIDEMAGLCPHPRVVATHGGRKRGLSLRPRRICPRCGHCEALFGKSYFQVLVGRPTDFFSPVEYLIQEGLVLKRLGINL
jgi:hypothetical protein